MLVGTHGSAARSALPSLVMASTMALAAGIRLIGGQAGGDAVVPLRHVAAQALGDHRRQAQRVGDHRRLDAGLLERLGQVDAALGVALGHDHVRALGAGRRQRADEVGRVGLVADALDLDARLLQARHHRVGALDDARHLRVDDRGRLGLQHVAAEGPPRGQDVERVAEEDEAVLVLGVDLVDRHAPEHRLLAGDARVQGLGAGRDRADADGVDGLVVGHLLAALLALLLGRRDEARVQLHGMAVDAAGVLVDVVGRHLGADRRVGPDVVGAALLVDVADDDGRLAVVSRAGRTADVLDVVRDPRALRGAGGRGTRALRGGRRTGGRASRGGVVVAAPAGRHDGGCQREPQRERDDAHADTRDVAGEVHCTSLLSRMDPGAARPWLRCNLHIL